MPRASTAAPPETETENARRLRKQEPPSRTVAGKAEPTVVDRDPATRDFYNRTDEFTVTAADRRKASATKGKLLPEEVAARAVTDSFYRFSFRNIGGLVMPVILKMDFADGSAETVRIPAEVWRHSPRSVAWQYVTPKTLARAEIDPLWETADADRSNNIFAGRIEPRTLGIETPAETRDRMRDSDLKVLPDSLETIAVPPLVPER